MTKKWQWFIPIGLAALGLILGSFYDLALSNAIYSERNWFGIAMSAFGTTPVYMMLAMCGVGYFMCGLKNKNILIKIILFCLSIGAIGASIYFQSDMVISRNAFNIEDKWYVGIIVGVLIAAIGGLLGYFLFKDVNDMHVVYVLIIMPLVLLLSILCVHFIKGVMSRPRYRFLIGESGIALGTENFKNWWQSGKELYESMGKEFKEEFRSFPSGHTVTATCLIPFLIYLPKIKPSFKKYENVLFYGGVVLTVIMGFSRILVGAHFLSDVSMAMLIASIIGFVTDILAFPNSKEEKNIEIEAEK